MRQARLAFLVTSATALVFAGRLALSARADGSVITACVQNGNGSLRVGSDCKKGEALLEWNVQGPQGPAGPAGPASSGSSSGGGALRVLDSQSNEVGVFESPGYVGLTVGSTIVFVNLDIVGQSFVHSAPTLYFTDAHCQSAPMMFLDMTRFGYVDNTGTLWFPAATQVSTSSGSFDFGTGCQDNNATTGSFGAVTKASVASFAAPFHLAR